MLRHHPRAQFTSARTGEGLDELRRAILGELEARTVEVEIVVLRREAELLSFCYREGRVTAQDQSAAGQPKLRVSFSDVAFKKMLKAHRGDFEIVAAPTHEEAP
jgi:50S ribosomal subunit-associated GTPase HflX